MSPDAPSPDPRAPEACLPDDLRRPTTTLHRLGGGHSGAALFRVEADARRYVLKLAPLGTSLESWRRGLVIQQRASDAGVAPRVLHHDEARRAILSEHVEHRGFAPRLFAPATRDAALRELAATIRTVHDLPLPPGASAPDPRAQLAPIWARLTEIAVPTFVRTALERVWAAPPPPSARPSVTSHNDLNPSNLAFDGTRLILLDWDAAGPNDPHYDLATVALFLRMDDATAAALVAAHDGRALAPLPAAFRDARRLVAAVCATLFLELARAAGHVGGEVAAADAPTLQEVHGLIGAGALAPSSADGAWAFALALARTIDHDDARTP